MPTTARLVAALCLAALGWVVSGQVIEVMPEQSEFGYFQLVTMSLGILCGWFVIGGRVGTDYVTSISIGLTGMAALVFWGLFAQASNEMLRLALARRYDGPVEAIVAVFQIGIEYSTNLGHLPIIMTLVVGGIATGLIAEFTHRRWS